MGETMDTKQGKIICTQSNYAVYNQTPDPCKPRGASEHSCLFEVELSFSLLSVRVDCLEALCRLGGRKYHQRRARHCFCRDCFLSLNTFISLS